MSSYIECYFATRNHSFAVVLVLQVTLKAGMSAASWDRQKATKTWPLDRSSWLSH